MAHTKATVVLVLALISLTCAQLDINIKTTTETPIDPTTSAKTEVPDTTTTATSTTEATTTSSTTTTTSTTTTEKPTSPSTTTVAPTVAPTPRPEPEYKKWSWPSDPNKTCVIIQLAVQLNLTYNSSVDNKPLNILYNVPVNGTDVVDGSCEKDSQSITVRFGKSSKMILTFKVNDSTSQFMLSEFDFSINATEEFKDAADKQIDIHHIQDDFATPLAMSYHCNKYQVLGFTTKDSKDIVANATISHVQLEAFHKQGDQFSTARDCEAIDTPDIVPIAVGCALAGLVVVVLIAYLVGRRRAQARGYLSM